MKWMIPPTLIILVLSSYLLSGRNKVEDFSQSSSTIKVLDRNGEIIRYLNFNGNIYSQNVELSKIPRVMQEVFLHAEDKRFYSHAGIDFISLTRALWQNINHSEIVSGASTVEQQLARIINKRPRTYLGKVRVLNDAFWISILNSKSQILEAYLNLLPFGHNIKGVWEASNYFFAKEPSELSYSEMAILATLPRSPSRLLRPENRSDLIKSKNLVLSSFFESRPDLESLKNLSLKEDVSLEFKKHAFHTPHFLGYLLSQCDEECRTQKEIKTGLDLHLQREVQKIVQNQVGKLKDKGVGSASALVIDNQTGEILSYIGSHDFFEERFGQNDGVLQRRQPGSTLKPLTYAYAFQNDHHPSSILPDVEMMFNVGGGVYKPRNYSNDYLGPVRASFALTNSLNIPALYLADYYGPESILNFYRSFGLDFPSSAEVYGIGLTLGNAELSLYDLVRAYTAFAVKGSFIDLTPFSRDQRQLRETAMSEKTALLIGHILSEDTRREHSFGRNSVLDFPFWFASKTGTSTNFRDNWVVGFNERFTVGVWAGNFDQASMHNVSGISGAGPIYHDIVKLVYSYFSREVMTPPRLLGSKKVDICPSSGMLKGPHCPHQLQESFLEGHLPLKECDVHREVLVRNCVANESISRVNVEDFSHQFDLWKQENNIATVEGQVADKCAPNFSIIQNTSNLMSSYVEIKSPVNGSLFGIDPNIPREYQRLNLEVVSESKINKVKWYLEDKFIGESTAQEPLYWPLSPGRKNLKAKVELENGKTITRNTLINIL